MDMIPGHPQGGHPHQQQGHPSMKPDVQIKSSMPASIYHIESRQLVKEPQQPQGRHVYHGQEVKQHDDRQQDMRQSHYEMSAPSLRRDQIHMYSNANLLQLSQAQVRPFFN